ncbi:MAG: hypothetical protein D6B26_02700 [Spirochaetaceae bacterium]|nr:MAG: hypothetical protein D6B26_02700 [Spirochaetaceae bacterium]
MQKLSEQLKTNMTEMGIDIDMTLALLQRIQAGEFDNLAPLQMDSMPQIDGRQIVDTSKDLSLCIPWKTLEYSCQELGLDIDTSSLSGAQSDPHDPQLAQLDSQALKEIGLALSQITAYGVLNGGSATSYCDTKKNRGFAPVLFDSVADEFQTIAQQATGRPKGLTPAWINPDGSPGASFLELKMRSLLIKLLRNQQRPGAQPPRFAPFFQMSSVHTHDELQSAYDDFRQSPLLAELIQTTGVDITRVMDATQPLLAAYTHSREGKPKQVFANAYGRPDTPVAVPGGHGQNFQVLADVYRKLYEQGARFVYLGNVDNIGFTVEPESLAWFALSDRPAAFEFSFKTPVDVKGGILIRDTQGQLTCGDIGPAVSPEQVAQAEAGGTPVLFNAATGLFRLDYLIKNLDRIIQQLPVRITDQDKDPGTYSQAEQVTWEVIGMIEKPVIFAVNKYRRFLAAKLLMENLLTSGRIGRDSFEDAGQLALKSESSRLHQGLNEILTNEYGMQLVDGQWVPLSCQQLLAE